MKHNIYNTQSYTLFSIPAEGEDSIPTKRDKPDSNEANIDQEDLNKGDDLNLQYEDEDSEDQSLGHTQNEYIGLDQETRSEEDNISRSSSGILYTLLDGIPRYYFSLFTHHNI